MPPVAVPTHLSMPVSVPVGTTVAPSPAAQPVAVGTDTVGTAVYVQVVGTKGEDLLAAQKDGTPIAVSRTTRLSCSW